MELYGKAITFSVCEKSRRSEETIELGLGTG